MNRTLRDLIWIWAALFAAAVFVFLVAMALRTPPTNAQTPPQTGNLVSGSGNTTNNSATTIIAAPTATRRIYVTSVECGRTDAGTSAIFVTLNDTSSTIVVIPNSGGGGGNTMWFKSPLTVPAATALTFTASSGVTTLYCNAQGFTGN
jgi:hypothetical protein